MTRVNLCALCVTGSLGIRSLRNLRALRASCGFLLNVHNRRDAENAEVAQRVETEPARALVFWSQCKAN